MRYASYDFDRAEKDALWKALGMSAAVRATTSPNPPVGCVIFRDRAPGDGEQMDEATDTEIIAAGATEPPGGRHAERVALDAAGQRACGANMLVTLEPCNHTGRTGPCAQAIVEAGISKVTYLAVDPNPLAAGGAQYLRDHGVEVRFVDHLDRTLNPWLTATRKGRVSVTAKFASTLDGFTAAPDGTSQWITGPMAREWVHADRARRDAIIIGTGTAITDNPSLTARKADGSLYENQPRRVVVGTREVPGGNLTRLGFEQYPTPQEALDALWETGARDVLVEGGPTMLKSFFDLGVVDEIKAFIAPMLFGVGQSVLGGAIVNTLGEAERYEMVSLDFTEESDIVVELRREGDDD